MDNFLRILVPMEMKECIYIVINASVHVYTKLEVDMSI